MTEKRGVLAAIVNLDEEQLRNGDDDGSYGTIDDIATGPRTTSTPQQQGHELRPSALSVEVDAADVALGTENDLLRVQDVERTCTGRKNRIKNAILSKWKPRNRPKRNEDEKEEQNDDVESLYVALDEAPIRVATPERSASVQSISVATEPAAANEPTADLLGLEKPQTQSSLNNSPEPPPKPLKLSSELFHWYIHRSWKKKLLTLLVVASSGVVLYDLLFCQGGRVKNFLDGFLYWMEVHPLLGIYGYIVVLAGTSLIYIPPSPLIISSGFIFRSIYGPLSGPVLALLASYVGAVLGGSIGYLRAHYMTRDLIRILMRRYPLLRAIDTAVVRNSLRVMILLRLNPLIPFGVLNYLFGISGVSGASFVLGVVGVVPWHLWLVSLGASANSLVYDMDEGEELLMIVLYGMGCAFGVIGLVITWKFAKKELEKEVNAQAINDFRIHDPDQAPQYTDRRNGIEIELSDMEFGDYVRMQFLGINVDDAIEVEEENYRSKLDWELLILDDFS